MDDLCDNNFPDYECCYDSFRGGDCSCNEFYYQKCKYCNEIQFIDSYNNICGYCEYLYGHTKSIRDLDINILVNKGLINNNEHINEYVFELYDELYI